MARSQAATHAFAKPFLVVFLLGSFVDDRGGRCVTLGEVSAAS